MLQTIEERQKLQRQYKRRVRQTPFGKAYKLWENAKARAVRDRLDFDLSRDEIEKILEKGVCQVTGVKFDLKPSDKTKSHFNSYAPSVDKVNCKKGYTKDNVQIVLHAVNQAKGELSMKEYKEITKLIWEGMNETTS